MGEGRAAAIGQPEVTDTSCGSGRLVWVLLESSTTWCFAVDKWLLLRRCGTRTNKWKWFWLANHRPPTSTRILIDSSYVRGERGVVAGIRHRHPRTRIAAPDNGREP